MRKVKIVLTIGYREALDFTGALSTIPRLFSYSVFKALAGVSKLLGDNPRVEIMPPKAANPKRIRRAA